MATSIKPLEKLQLGIESAKGTAVAATRVLVGDWNVEDEQDFYRSSYPQGYRSNVGGAGVITRKGVVVDGEMDLSAEQLLWFLLTGVRGAVSPVAATLSGTSNVAVTTSSTTLADSRLTGGAALVVNYWVGATVTCDSKTGVVVSNTATTFTVVSWTGGTPTTGSAWSVTGLDQLWTFTAQLTTGIPTIDAATMEFVESDGSTNHYLVNSAYGMTESFKIAGSFNQVGKVNAKMFGRARQSTAPTSSLSPYSTLEPLVTPLLAVYLDSTWAGLGGTQLTSIVRSYSVDYSTGFMPDYTADQRSDRDMVQHKVGLLTAKLNLVLELNATAAARITSFRSNDIVFIRLKNIGSGIGGATATNYRYVQLDGAYRFTGTPKKSADGEQVLVAIELESVLDTTSSKTLEFVVNNGLTAVA